MYRSKVADMLPNAFVNEPHLLTIASLLPSQMRM